MSAAILLAAGHGRRFGADKMLRAFRGQPLFLHALEIARAAPVERIVVVTQQNAEAQRLCHAAYAEDQRIVHTIIETDALSASLRAGLETAGEGPAFIFLGDMPLVPADMAARLAHDIGERFAALPIYKGQPGHPVLLSARAAAEAVALKGDQGAGPLLRKYAHDVVRIETEDEGVVLDVDTEADLNRLVTRGAS